ncbi:hypothetical protein ACFZCY_13415 [Streptomyces sp. NPDC007983]|uniref:hypothetical protein n=1 Tax=Streptomyces sp. NPDC007983 TaxID=3364800 RepID=UPI0036E7DBE6
MAAFKSAASGFTTQDWAAPLPNTTSMAAAPLFLRPVAKAEAAYVQHTQFDTSVATLRAMGVRVLYGEGGFVPNKPGQGRPEDYPWHLALDEAVSALRRRDSSQT